MDKIKIDMIDIGPRFRKEMGDIEPLKTSLGSRGQFQPIVIRREKNKKQLHDLVAGERRLNAAKELGWVDIGYTFLDRVDDLTAKEIELEENLCRKSFTPEEEVKAILDIHKLKCAKYGQSVSSVPGGTAKEWTLQDTADSLGISKASLILYITVAKHLEDMPLVGETLRREGLVAAHKIVRHNMELQATSLMSSMATASMEKDLEGDSAGSAASILAAATKLVDSMWFHGDCTVLIKKLPDKSIHLIYTDPPYGIEIDKVKSKEFKADVYTNDTPQAWVKIWDVLSPELYRVAADNSYAFVWISWEMLDILANMMIKAGWRMAPLPFVWARQGVGAQSLNPSRYLASSVDFALIFMKGDPMLAKEGQPNSSIARALPDIMKTHPLERPLELVLDNIQTFALPGSVVLDCFGGGASTAKACLAGGMRNISFELGDDYYKRSRMELIGMMSGQTPKAS